MRAADERAQRGGGGQIHQVVPDAPLRSQPALAEQPDFRREPTVAPVVGRCDARRAEAGAPRCVRAVAPRHGAPLPRRLGRGPAAPVDGVRVGRQSAPVRGRPLPVRGAGASSAGVPSNLEIGRHAQGIRQLGTVQRAAQRGVVAELRIAHDGGQRKACRADLAQQRQGQSPFRRKLHHRGNASRVRCRGVSHSSGKYNVAPSSHARVPVQSPTVTAVWQFATLPRAPQYCRATPTESGPCFGKLVPSRINTPVRSGTCSRSRFQRASASQGHA